MSLDNQTRKTYRSIGHKLNPVVTVKDLSASVTAEIERALNDHELIKIKIMAEDREAKTALIDEVCRKVGAELIQVAGHVALILRPAQKPNPALSNLERHRRSQVD
jgi:RNA-binding protein